MGSRGWLGGLYYVQNLAGALAALPGDERPVAFAFVPADDETLPVEEIARHARVVPFAGASGSRLESLARRVSLPSTRRGTPRGIEAALATQPVDVLFPALDWRGNGDVHHLAWAWDTQHLSLPELFPPDELERRTATFARLATHAPIIVVSSETGAETFAAHFPDAADRLRILRFTTVPDSDWLDGDPTATAASYGIAGRYALIPNHFWVHKNHAAAFDALRILNGRGVELELVCTGTRHDSRWPNHVDDLVAGLRRDGIEGAVHILGPVPRNDYVRLLRGAVAMVQPSRFEGWSSVVEDARALARPAVLSDIPVHREQALDGARYFDPDAPDELADRLEELLGEPAAGEIDEVEALVRQRSRVVDYGRTFVEIAVEATESSRD